MPFGRRTFRTGPPSSLDAFGLLALPFGATTAVGTCPKVCLLSLVTNLLSESRISDKWSQVTPLSELIEMVQYQSSHWRQSPGQLTGSCLAVDFDATLAHRGCVKGSDIRFQVRGIPHSSRLFLVRRTHFFHDLPLTLRRNRGAEHSGEGTHEVGGLQCM